MIYLEMRVSSFQISIFAEENKKNTLRTEFDPLAEKRYEAELRTIVYKQRNTKYYNQKICIRKFEIGDGVLRKVFITTQKVNIGSLGPNWKKPYKINKILSKGFYEIKDMQGYHLMHLWNTKHLKKYY